MRINEAYFRCVFETSSFGIIVVDRDKRIVLANAVAMSLFAYEPDTLSGKPFALLLPDSWPAFDETRDMGRVHLPKTIRVGQSKDGRRFPLEISMSFAHVDEQPVSIAFVGVQADSATQTAHSAHPYDSAQYIQETFELLDPVLRNTEDVAVVNEQLRYQVPNERMSQSNGLLPDAYSDQTVVVRNAITIGKVLNKGETQAHIRVISDETRYWLASYSPFHKAGEAGRNVGVVINDSTARKRAEIHQETRSAVTRILTEYITHAEANARFLEAICLGEGWDRGEVWRVDDTTQRLHLHSAWSQQLLDTNEFIKQRQKATFPRGIGVVGQAWASGTPQWHAPHATENSVPDRLAGQAGIQTMCACPIHANNNIIGIIVFLSRAQRARDQEFLVVCQDVSRQIGHFLERKKHEDRLLLYNQQHTTLQHIAQNIFALQSSADIAQTTLRHIGELVPCDRASFLLLDLAADKGQIWWDKIDIVSSREYRPSAAPQVIEVLKRGEAHLINDLGQVACLPHAHQLLRDAGFRSHINVPIIIQDVLIGAVNLSSKQSNAFTPDVINVLQKMTRLLATALQKVQLFEQVQTEYKQLRLVSNRLYQTLEEGRYHIAGELQDSIGHSLTLVDLNLQMLAKNPAAQTIVARLEENTALLEQMIQQVRALAFDLRPPLLDDMGLVAALRWLFNQQAEQAGFTVELESNIGEDRYSCEIETTFMRVAQEAASNITRYAQASKVTVGLQKTDRLQLVISDNGVGFDVAQAFSVATQVQRIGLLNMHELTRSADGACLIESTVGGGATITIWLPIEYEKTEDIAEHTK